MNGNFNYHYTSNYLIQIGKFKGQAKMILLFLAVDRGLIYRRIKDK